MVCMCVDEAIKIISGVENTCATFLWDTEMLPALCLYIRIRVFYGKGVAKGSASSLLPK